MNNSVKTQNTKMQWFINNYNNGTLTYNIKHTGYNFGSINMPTGTGKSGVVYADIVSRIDAYNNSKLNKKLVFNISCPILKLTQQFINDLMDVLSVIYPSETFKLYINSSDTSSTYNTSDVVDIMKYSKFVESFVNDENTKFAIVASCHKSLPKFINSLTSSVTKVCDVISYIDESHLIDPIGHTEDDNIIKVNINKLCKNSKAVFALSATSDANVTRSINMYNKFGKESTDYIYMLSPITAINNGTILPPYVHYCNTKCEGIDAQMCISVMQHEKSLNNKINQKILVTLNSSEELKKLREELEKYDYKVFSTCAKYGFGVYDKKENNNTVTVEEITDPSTVLEFIDEIEKYDGDCFILHIRQLIQGIDIKSITGCIIWSNSNANTESYRHIIQIIGRTLRTLKDEYELSKEKRADMKKPYGAVYFVTEKDDDRIQKNLTQFIMRYYGINNVLFDTKQYRYPGNDNSDELWDTNINGMFNTTGWDNAVHNDLLMSIKSAVKNLSVRIQAEKKWGIKTDINTHIQRVANQYTGSYIEDKNTIEFLLDNYDIIEKIKELLKEYM